ncbi:MAG TPA: hypothetical protein VFX30_01685 [bacterium]|nr:hypothetical protein [bacterium]
MDFIKRLTVIVLALGTVWGLGSFASADEAGVPVYDACRYAKHLITQPETFHIGGIVGTPWLEAAVCQETGEACDQIGHLCGGDVPGYQNLENLCGGNQALKVCVPKNSANDENGVCVSFTDGCLAAADSCRDAACSFAPWSPTFPPVPIQPGQKPLVQAQFATPSYDRPVACIFTPKPNAPGQCSFRANPEPKPCDPKHEICNFTTPPPPPTEHPCDDIADPELRDCCNQHGGLNLDAIEACIPDSDDPSDACNIIVHVGGDVNGQMNVCCNYVNNDGIIQDSEVVQECKNSFPGQAPEGEPTPGTPEGSESAGEGFSCAVTALDAEKVDGKFISLNKDGLGIRLAVAYSGPAVEGAASVEIAQTDGPAVTWEGPSSVPFSSSATWTVQMGRPDTLMGEYIPNAEFLVTVRDAAGGILNQTSCAETAGIQAKGGSSGCSLVEGELVQNVTGVAKSLLQWILSAGALIPLAGLRRLLSLGNRGRKSRR